MARPKRKPVKAAPMPVATEINIRAAQSKFHLACRIGKMVGLAVLHAYLANGYTEAQALELARGELFAAMGKVFEGKDAG